MQTYPLPYGSLTTDDITEAMLKLVSPVSIAVRQRGGEHS